MTRLGRSWIAAAIIAVGLGTGGTTPFAAAQEPPPAEMEKLVADGPGARMAILPVRVLGRTHQNIAEVLGLTLEGAGMDRIDVATEAFDGPPDAPFDGVPGRLSTWIKAHPPKADYVLYAEYLGDPRSGPTEVRFIVANAAGLPLLVDRQTPNDADFQRTAAKDPDPLGCSVLVTERLFKRLGWPIRHGEAKGKFAKLWAEKSGLPPAAEREAMVPRAAAMKASLKASSVLVLPAQVGTGSDPAAAERIAALLAKDHGIRATAATSDFAPKIDPSPNEQKRLWALARATKEAVRAHPSPADYTVATEILVSTDHPERGSVHVIVCDKAGEWVIVDFCNDQHPDYQRIAPASPKDGERLAVVRLLAALH